MTHTETHSPLPQKFVTHWVRTGGDVGGYYIMDANGAEMTNSLAGLQVLADRVNALPSLVEALEKCRDEIKAAFDDEHLQDQCLASMAIALMQAEAALALAKGE